MHYFSFRELWLDETFILNNLKNLGYPQLIGPLKHCQAFPRAYLLIIKFFAEKFNYTILSLRFFPLVSMLVAFVIWIKIYRRIFSFSRDFLLILLSWVSGYALVYYSSELKQYSLDVLIFGVFVLYLIHQQDFKDKKPTLNFTILSLALPCLIPLSYSSVFIFWLPLFNFLFLMRSNKKIIFISIAYAVSSLFFIWLLYFFDLRFGLLSTCLFQYWNGYFLCTDSLYCFMRSFAEGISRFVVWFFGTQKLLKIAGAFLVPFFLISLFVRGVKSLKKERFKVFSLDAIGLVLFTELFILGLLKKYPFTGERITLFSAPIIFYFIVTGIGLLKKKEILYYGFTVFYCVFLIFSSANSFLKILKLYF